MKKLSDFKGDDALELLSIITEPIMLIVADSEIHELAEKNAPYSKYIKPILSKHKDEIVTILSALNGVDENEYRANISLLTLPKELLDLFNDEEVQKLFQSAK